MQIASQNRGFMNKILWSFLCTKEINFANQLHPIKDLKHKILKD